MSNKKFNKTKICMAIITLVTGNAVAQSEQEGSASAVQEVIVTAQRVAQPASKTPLSLSVLGGEELKQAGAINASSLTELVPNIQIANNGGPRLLQFVESAVQTPRKKATPPHLLISTALI